MSFVSVLFLLARVGAMWWPLCALGGSFLTGGSRTCLAESQWVCVCPLFQCSFCLQGLGPFGGPCAPWESGLLSRLRLGSMGKPPRSTCITWSIAEVLGLVWLSLKGVCGLCFSALSACKGWGHVVAPVRPGRLIFDGRFSDLSG